MPPRFFLTHSWKDLAFVKRLCDDLHAAGLDGFFDAYSIQPGDIISREISQGLESCDVYVPVLSHAALQSPWCEEEIHAAITLGKLPGRNGRPRIVPILVENCEERMPILLRSRLYITFCDRYDEALPELITRGFGVPFSAKPPEQAGAQVLASPEQPIRNSVPASEPDRTTAQDFFNRGVAYDHKFKWDAAIRDYTRAIEFDPKHALAYYNRGLAYRRKGAWDMAIQDYTCAIELDPKYADPYYNRGIAHGRKGAWDMAIQDYTRAIELDPNYADAYNNRGLAYWRIGNKSQAKADFESYLRLRPNASDRAAVEHDIRELSE